MMKIIIIMAILLIVISLLTILDCTWAFQQQQQQQNVNPSASDQLPKGYYAFVKAPLNARPPKVRKPPYLPITAECPGVHDVNTLVPKNNMCGDLNRGFIPRNPMGQYLFGQPYPFEIIKNKTLQYLSKTLPYLKEEIENVPKVARFVKPSEFFKNHSKRHARQANFEENSTSQPKADNVTVDLAPETKQENNNSNSTKQNRQGGCEGNVICQAIESLKEEGPFSKSFLSNVVSAVGNVASINNVVSLIDQYSQSASNQSSVNASGNRFALSQLLSSVSSISDSSNSGQSSSGNGNSYSPLLSIIDYIQSLQTPKYATKRKTSPDMEDYIPEGPEKPQTPCMSTEEYISPTYARNYQGVWKYVVQIPNEGYFTQTIQQTTCLKTKCDLIEGSCRESPRWVSLLVAEIFYPDIYFPVNQIMPMIYKQQQIIQQQQQQQQFTSSYKPMNQNNNINNKRIFPMPIQASNQLNGLDLNVLTNLLKRNEAVNGNGHPALQNLELLARKARTDVKNNENEINNNNEDNNVDSATDTTANNNNNKKQHCDGYDKIGCYVVRVYYDWFLVNGSCKCWKTSSSGSINETIKRIFIGKWKKK